MYIHLSVATDKGTELNSYYTIRTRLQMYIHISVAIDKGTELNSAYIMRTRLHTFICSY
jgi:hypothetical protein